MGNKQSLNPAIPKFQEQQWEEVSTCSSDHPQYGYYRTLRHVETGQLVDEYELAYTDEQDYKFYLNSFIWRLRQSQIVKTMYLKEEHRQQFCSRTYLIKVYIQHIETRVSDITDIPYPENLYVALSVLDGYHKLYENLQYFKVEQNQIGVDQNGHIRVWINSDLSKDYPSNDQDTQNGDQTTMVNQIMAIVTDNTDRDSEPEPLKDYLLQRGSKLGFQEAKVIISEYARKHNSQVPQCFQSILQIYRKQNDNHSVQQFDDQQAHDKAQNALDNQHLLRDQRVTPTQVYQLNQAESQLHPRQFQPWHFNGKLNPHIISNGRMETVHSAEVNYSDKNHRSIPNLHTFQNQGTANSQVNASYNSVSHAPYNISDNRRRQMPRVSHIMVSPPYNNPLGFQPVYKPLNQSPIKIPSAAIPSHRHGISYYSPNQGSSKPSKNFSIASFSPQHFNEYRPTHFRSQLVNNIDNEGLKFKTEVGELKEVLVRDKMNNIPRVSILPPVSDAPQSLDHTKSLKNTFKECIDRSQSVCSPKQNNSFKNLQQIKMKKRQQNERRVVSGVQSQSNQNLNSRHMMQSRDAITEHSYLSHNNALFHGREQILRNPVSSTHYHEQDKTYYFTLDTEEELDPEIAADLQKMLEF